MNASEALHRLLQETASVTGDDFFRAFARVFAEVLGARYGIVGRLVDGDHVRVLAVWEGDGFGDPFEYSLRGTPCEGVVGAGVCFYPSGVAKLFPKDALLGDMGIESYYGVPVLSPSGAVLGVLVGLHNQERPTPKDFDPILRTFAMRVAAEMERVERDEKTALLIADLAKSEARYRRFVTECIEGIWAIDDAGKTTFANAQMAAMLGYGEDEMLGRSMFDFMDERARAEATKNMARRRSGAKERHEFRFRHRDGSDVWMILSTSPLHDDAGKFSGALAFASDVTVWRGLELRVQQAQKLESVGLLAGGIAHDFNNLLVGILGNVGLAQQEIPAEAPASAHLRRIETTALRAADLTRQLLAYAGKGTFVLKTVDLNHLIREMADLLATVINKNATLELLLHPEPLFVEADTTQLGQVLLNLITNASDALDNKTGVITISTAFEPGAAQANEAGAKPGEPPEGQCVVIKVADTGVGMDAATLSNLFEPFFTTKFAGRGLGLSAVQGILRSHHGTIDVESRPNGGTCFTLRLPHGEPPQTAAAPENHAPKKRGSGLVLIVDDEPSVRRVASAVLHLAGYEVLEAADGEEALTKFADKADDIVAVLLDLTMPGLSGEETLDAMRQIRAGVRVVLTSGYAEQGARPASQLAPAAFLAKPWRAEQLVAVLNDVVSGHP